jgi:ATP-dependent Clp protease protease subunit
MGSSCSAPGTKGKRYALPHARIMMHQPSSGMGGSASDIKIQAQQSLHIKKVLLDLIAQHTGQSVEQVVADADRDRWFTAEQAVDTAWSTGWSPTPVRPPTKGRPAAPTRQTRTET